MNYSEIIKELKINRDVFHALLIDIPKEQYLWKPQSDRWSLLEIVCHLYDEEREDFRIRTKHVLENPADPLPSINPTEWVQERKYLQQDYTETLNKFLNERTYSVEWLQSYKSPKWDNYYSHQKFGKMTAKMFLSNWLAHDYLHIRQILKLKFDYLKQKTDETLEYAGAW